MNGLFATISLLSLALVGSALAKRTSIYPSNLRSTLCRIRGARGGIAAGRQVSPAAKVAAYFPVLTKLTQSPWFLNFRGMVKVSQPPFSH